SFDEYNVWYQNKQSPAGWIKKPHILEDIYSHKDALVFAGMLNTLLNNCDRVEIACLAQLVNVIAPIFTAENGIAYRQTIFFPFKLASQYKGAKALRTIISAPTFLSRIGHVNEISQSIVYDEIKRDIAVFLVNYADEENIAEVELRSFGKLNVISHKVLISDDLEKRNTLSEPEAIKLIEVKKLPLNNDGILCITLPKYSYNAVIIKY
ncbi:MAG: alpha-N-arabinofuranosidase, partial [Bacillales bacterium]|nr:alpha-N-arabinofuranosidase [Bacillales bacterium]